MSFLVIPQNLFNNSSRELRFNSYLIGDEYNDIAEITSIELY